MNSEIRKQVSEWANGNFELLKLIHIDDGKFVMQFENKKFAIFFRELFGDSYEALLTGNTDEYQRYKSIDYYIKRDDFNIASKNNKLIKFPCVGFKCGDYIELFFNYGNVSYQQDYLIKEFNIEDVEVEIGSPSEMFQLVFKQLEDDKYLGDWEMNETLKLSGVNNDNYKSLVQQALFYIGYCNPSVYIDEYPRIIAFSGKYYNVSGYEFDEREQFQLTFNEQIEKSEFKKIKFPEVISFYNAAVSMKDEEISFLYFYKVLEYFFIINQKSLFVANIEFYNSTGEINEFINKTNKIYKQGEEELLTYLLNSIEDKIGDILNFANHKGLTNGVNIIDISKGIYNYRNSIVHGKGDYKFDLKIPDDIEKGDDKMWILIIQEIAHILIFKHCLEMEKKYSPTFE